MITTVKFILKLNYKKPAPTDNITMVVNVFLGDSKSVTVKSK